MKILSYAIFVSSCMLIMSLLLIFWSWSVSSFDRFNIRTSQQNIKVGQSVYVPSSQIDTPVIALALANMRMGNKEYHGNTEISWIFTLMKQQRALLTIDIIELLKQDPESNREVLNAHLRHLVLVHEQTVAMGDILQDRARILAVESDACLERKRSWDQQFFLGLQQWDNATTQEWLFQSLEYAPCYITKRIEANATNYLASYLWVMIPFLRHREQLLTHNQELLLQYHGLFEWTLLDELYLLRQQVLAVQYPSTTDVEKVFSFWKLDADTPLPTYNTNTIFFPNGKIPTFDNPWIGLRSGF